MVTKMKTLQMTLMISSFVFVMGCAKHEPDNSAKMALDSEPSGKNVTVVRGKEAVRPGETIPDFKELPNIMQHDIEAAERTESKAVIYVKPGEAVRPAEKKQ
jgi:hypothetical protein